MSKTKEERDLERAQIKEARAMVKSINKRIIRGRKEEKGLVKKFRYKKHCANDYDEVYRQFGRAIYRKCVPRDIREQSLENAIKEGRYMDVCDIHGREVFDAVMDKMASKDIATEADSKRHQVEGWVRYALPLKIRRIIKRQVCPIVLTVALGPAALMASGVEAHKWKENKGYKFTIEEYLDDIDEYANIVKSYDLNTIQTLMKVNDDMWSRIEGYGTPKVDLMGYSGIDVSKEMGVGVCRNMADDCARRLNAINKKFNARKIAVELVHGEYQPANIEMNYCTQNQTEEQPTPSNEENPGTNPQPTQDNPGSVTNPENNDEYYIKVGDKKIVSFSEEDVEKAIDKIAEIAKAKTGNHAVVLVDSVEDGVTLVFDPTNAGVGIFHNGQITMFNSQGGHPLKLEYKPYGEAIFGMGPMFYENAENLFCSLGIYPEKRMHELYKKYGIEAQNEALDYVRSLKQPQYTETLKADGTYEITQPQSEVESMHPFVDDNDRE